MGFTRSKTRAILCRAARRGAQLTLTHPTLGPAADPHRPVTTWDLAPEVRYALSEAEDEVGTEFGAAGGDFWSSVAIWNEASRGLVAGIVGMHEAIGVDGARPADAADLVSHLPEDAAWILSLVEPMLPGGESTPDAHEPIVPTFTSRDLSQARTGWIHRNGGRAFQWITFHSDAGVLVATRDRGSFDLDVRFSGTERELQALLELLSTTADARAA